MSSSSSICPLTMETVDAAWSVEMDSYAEPGDGGAGGGGGGGHLLSPAASSCSSGSCDSTAAAVGAPGHHIPGDTLLPAQLVAAGWRRLWSRREKRHYYWNHRTNQSLWDLPAPSPASSGALTMDSLSDPLGISQPGPAVYQPSTPTILASSVSAGTLKRKSSEELAPHAGHKRFVVLGPWDLEVCTNVVMYERTPITNILHAHPDIELLRAQLTAKLRCCYQEMCHSREAIDAPVGSFGRWLMERRLVDTGTEPLLPSRCSPQLSLAMYREIMADLPMRLVRPKFTGEARKQLSRYCEAAKKMIESSRTTSSESRKIVKWNVEDTFQWLRRTVGASFDDFDERLTHLCRQCRPHLTAAARASVEGICLKIYHLSAEYAGKIRQRHLQLLKEMGITELPGPLKVDNARKVWCHAAPMLTPCSRLPAVEFLHDGEAMLLRYRGETLRINTVYVQKLEQLYRYSCAEDRKLELFLTRVWCLLRRYNTYWGGATAADTPAAQASQMSLPLSVMECLNRHFCVTFELFASPFNCYFRQYCSPFVDTDVYFGSRGPACQLEPVHGSFVVHPPCSDPVQLAAIEHVERLLDHSCEPLSFIFVIGESSQQQHHHQQQHHQQQQQHHQQQQTDTASSSPASSVCSSSSSSTAAAAGAAGAGEGEGVSNGEQQQQLEQPSHRLQNSCWKRRQISLPALEHSYRHGFQHTVNRSEVAVKSWYSTLVVWLQNEAGHVRWCPSQERVDALLEAFRPGSQRQRDLQQQQQQQQQQVKVPGASETAAADTNGHSGVGAAAAAAGGGGTAAAATSASSATYTAPPTLHPHPHPHQQPPPHPPASASLVSGAVYNDIGDDQMSPAAHPAVSRVLLT